MQETATGMAYRMIILAVSTLLCGCTGISIAPSCPNELAVGESAPVLANEINPGEIERYFWEVIPSNVGRIADPTAASTRIEALAEGEAKVQLTASDGLYQVISFCTTRVSGTAPPPPDNENDNVDDNTNANDNTNTNDNVDNTNDNGDKPDRPGGGRKQTP